MTNEQRQQQPPRRILEKSRTVRRRYQRSNKRLEFTPSQIQRIERGEERERKAQRLRENEKKKLANKRKKAEKEAKEREERRRLGIPDSNAFKIPASQPLLLNFFGAGNKAEEVEEAKDEQSKECREMSKESTEVQQEDATDDFTETFSDADTEIGDDWLDDIILNEHIIKECAHASPLTISNSSTSVLHQNNQPKLPVQTIGGPPTSPLKLSDSFEDDTALLLQTLDPDVLQTFEPPKQPQQGFHSFGKTGDIASASDAIQNMKRSIISSTSHSTCVTRQIETPRLTESAKIMSSRGKHMNNDNFKEGYPSPRFNTGQTSARLIHEIGTPYHDAFALVQERKQPETAPVGANRRLCFSPKRTISQEKTRKPIEGVRPEMHANAEDEYDDLPLSTQDVRDLDSMIGLG